MPTYEYYCANCDRRVSIFFRSFGAVEDDPECPRCAQRSLTRRMSRFWSRRSSPTGDAFDQPVSEYDGVPLYGEEDSFDADYADDYEGAGETEDIATIAREARAMAAMMGEPLDREFDTALQHIEQGADPDDVFGEIDTRSPEVDPDTA